MRTRQYEVIFIVFILFIIIYFFSYKYYFENLCIKYTWENNLTKIEILEKMWSCTDSYVCHNNNIEYDELRRNVTNWQCNKKKVNYFEWYYYSNRYNNFKDKLFK
jgi:hypothetical protein